MAQHDWLYGIHALEAVVNREPERLIELYVLKGRDDERLRPIINQARRFGVAIQFCQRRVLDDKVGGEQHQGVVAKAKPAKPLDENDLAAIVASAAMPFLLVLDGVTDPHNLGACLRTADAGWMLWWCLKTNLPALPQLPVKSLVVQLKWFPLFK